MDLKQQRVLQSLRRVQAWCAANPGPVPALVGPSDAWSPLTRQLAVVNDVVVQLTDTAAEQVVHARQVTLAATDERALRKQLRHEMRTVTQVAQALRKTVPGIGTLKMPSSNTQVEGLLKAANALSREAFVYQAVLVDHGVAPDFVAQIDAAISLLRASVDGRGAARASQVSATRRLGVTLGLAHRHVSIMDSALAKALESDPGKLAEWKNAKRVTIKGVPTGTPALAMHTAALSVLTPTSIPALLPAGIPEPDAKAA